MKISDKDKERISKAQQAAYFLEEDLRNAVKSDSPLLSEISLELLEQAVKIHQKLKRVCGALEDEGRA